MKFPTPSTFKFNPAIHAEKRSNLPTMTQPQQSLTIQQILDRFTRGLPVNSQQRTPSFSTNPQFDDPDIEKLRHADLFEKEEFSRKFGEDIKQAKAHKEHKDKSDAEEAHKRKNEEMKRMLDEHLKQQKKEDPK